MVDARVFYTGFGGTVSRTGSTNPNRRCITRPVSAILLAMLFFGTIIAVLAGGALGFWIGSSRTRAAVNRSWMRSLEEARTDGLISDRQQSDLIRIQDAHRGS